MELVQKIGPCGGIDGSPFIMEIDQIDAKMISIEIYCGSKAINAIRVVHQRKGKEIFYSTWGSIVGSRHQLNLGPNEFLIKLTGFLGLDSNNQVVIGLTIVSNLETYGPIGRTDGVHFSLAVHGKIIGFHGRLSGALSGGLSSIGVYVDYGSEESDFKTTDLLKLGPCGGISGSQFGVEAHYRGYSLKKINISQCDVIDSIQLTYENLQNKTFTCSHGGSGGNLVGKIHLEPAEYLIKVSGFIREFMGREVIASLTITSNLRMYGPYGKENGVLFSLSSNKKIIEFHGRSMQFINAIGVYACD